MKRVPFIFVLFVCQFIMESESEWITYEKFFRTLIDTLKKDLQEGNIIRTSSNCGKNMIGIPGVGCGKIIHIG